MGSLLIVMPKQEDANRIAHIVQSGGLMLDIEICSSGADVLRIVHSRDYGAVICTQRLRDMGYSELAEYLPDYWGMIILTSDLSLGTFSDKIVKLSLPIRRGDLINTVDMMISGFHRIIKKKKQTPRKRNEQEQQIIDKAKMLLMDRNGMTEPEAFRYIQKCSMDAGRSMVESAEMILVMNNE